MSQNELSRFPDLKDVERGSDADETPNPARKTPRPALKSPSEDAAVAMPQGRKPGPKDSPAQVRNAGENSDGEVPKEWDEIDEAVDESFPASDASAKY